ncbi:hypothetical protein TorRG33x02_216600 [Trema orientale]|uniref:RNase H type-1 domain-containing protein n=1 Tax=Trema orientale TaxID=63057 RepID=A0A2P5EAJ6_TREOI|nr:hypothetical protein TorRG33x02_216600 [Trema orientale]
MANCDKKWKAPAMGQLKLNVDAAIKSSLGFISIGAVVRDCHGVVLGALSSTFAGHLSPSSAECVAVHERIKFKALEGPMVRDISRLLDRLRNASYRFTCCSCNAATHNLAQFAFLNNISQCWFYSIPDWLTTIILDDLT